MKMVTDLGEHEVIDYMSQAHTQNGETYDVIFDTASGDGFRASKRSLTRRGRYVTVYFNLLVMFQMLTTAVGGGRKVASSVVLGDQELSHDVAELLAQGVIWPVLAERYPLARIADAHQAVETGQPAGAVVVCISDAARAAASQHESAAARVRRTA